MVSFLHPPWAELVRGLAVKAIAVRTGVGALVAVALALGVALAPAAAQAAAKDAAIVVDGQTGKVLYARDANAQRYPASLTKMMTLYMLFEAIQEGRVKLDTPMKASAHAAAQEPSKLGLSKGDAITVETAIKALVVRSANDVAVVVAEALGRTESRFAQLMTRKARQIGMKRTTFRNASGLPHPEQVTTARDLATLGRQLAYDFPQFFHYFSTESFTWRGRVYQTHNNLIGKFEGADGIKTGYTRASGFNLVSSVTRGGVHIVAVVMGGKTSRVRDAEMIRLLDETFARIERNPTMVAHASTPWQVIASAPKPNPAKADGPALASAASFAAVPEVKPLILSTLPPEYLATKVIEPTDDPGFEAALAEPALDDVDSLDIFTPPLSPEPQAKPVLAAFEEPAGDDLAYAEGDIGGVVRSVIAPQATPGARSWAVQIGAFEDALAAQAQLAAAAERSMDVLGRAERIVVPFQSVDGRKLYRARFGPFAEREAREVCRRMTERGQTCFAATLKQ